MASGSSTVPVRPRVLVVGSINQDLVIRCAKLPLPGQSRFAASSHEISGGKGANQAVAAARMGGEVQFLGRVGDDAFANRLAENLRHERIDLTYLHGTPGTSSGLAIVMVEDSGENSILVVPGANGCVTTVDVQQAEQAFRQCDCVIVQWEIPAPAIAAAINMAKRFGKRIIMNPAPFQDGFRSLIPGVDLIIPNQTETAGILGVHVESSAAALEALPKLLGLGASNAIITLGGSGAVVSDGLRSAWLQPLKVEAVDTTAAGDAFVGALAVAWARHACLFTAARYAIAASALAVTRHGAQPSLPRQDEVEALMARIPEPEFAN